MVFLIYFIIFISLLFYFFQRNSNYWSSRNIPSEKPFLFFGNFYNVATRKEHFSETVRQIYNKHKTSYVGIYIFMQPMLMVRSPELLKKILVKDFDKFVNRPIASNEEVDPIAYHTLFSSRDATWRSIRAKISPVFTSGKMKLMLPLMKECARDLVSHLKERQTVDARDLFRKYSVDVISSCAFGINSYCLKDDNSEILKMSMQLIDLKSFVRNISIFSFFFLPKLVNLFKLTFLDKTSSDYFMEIFHKTMKEREKLRLQRNDLIDLLYDLKKNESFADSYKFDDQKMAAQAVVFFSAGNDTTSSTLSFALYEMAINKDIQDRLRSELQENCDENGDFSYEVLLKLKYLDMVLKETHRKYPLTTFLIREVATDYTIEETGTVLKKGESIFVPLAGIQYDVNYYPNPEIFDPERFNDDNKKNHTQYTYMPFGEGPRVCIGERFANLVSKLALAYAIKNFAFEICESTPVPMELDPTSLFMRSTKDLILKVTNI